MISIKIQLSGVLIIQLSYTVTLMSTIPITVLVSEGNSLCINIKNDTTVIEAKQLIAQEIHSDTDFDVNTRKIELKYEDCILSNSDVLMSMGMMPYDEIIIFSAAERIKELFGDAKPNKIMLLSEIESKNPRPELIRSVIDVVENLINENGILLKSKTAIAVRTLLECGFDPCDSFTGITPLEFFLLHNRLDCARVLLESDKVNPNYEGKNSIGPLYRSIEEGNTDAVELLISFGVNVVDRHHTWEQFDEEDDTSSEIDRSLWVYYPLTFAAYHNNLDICRLLISHGAVATATAPSSEPALQIAKQSHADHELITFLKKEIKKIEKKKSIKEQLKREKRKTVAVRRRKKAQLEL